MKEFFRYLARGEALDGAPGDWVSRAESPDLAAAIIALGDAEGRQRWSETIEPETAAALERIAFVSADGDAVDRAVDDALGSEAGGQVVDALARAGVAWTHPTLESALDDPQLRAAGALLLAVAEPQALDDWLDGCEVFEDALVVLRAVAMAGATELGDRLSDWRERVDEFDEAGDEVDTLDALSAVLDAEAFARLGLAGEVDIGWLADSRHVADFLQVYGPGEWLPVLAFLDVCDDDAFEFGAFLSVCAANGIGFEEPEEADARDLLELLGFEPGSDPEDWEPLATRLGFGFAVSVAADDELALLGAQVGAHERLTTFGFHSPGVPGLPMSGTDAEALDFDASNAILRRLMDGPSMPDSAKVSVLRTLHDLYNHVRFGDGACKSHAQTWVARFQDSDVDAIAMAARQLRGVCDGGSAAVDGERERVGLRDAMVLAACGESPDGVVDALSAAAGGEKVLGLGAAQQLALLGTTESLEALAALWADGPLFRAPIFRDAILTGAHVATESREDS